MFEFLCLQCGQRNEVLVTSPEAQVTCLVCEGKKPKKMLSAPSILSGQAKGKFPGPGDTACYGVHAVNAAVFAICLMRLFRTRENPFLASLQWLRMSGLIRLELDMKTGCGGSEIEDVHSFHHDFDRLFEVCAGLVPPSEAPCFLVDKHDPTTVSLETVALF